MSARRDFLRNCFMSISISVLPKILRPMEVVVEDDGRVSYDELVRCKCRGKGILYHIENCVPVTTYQYRPYTMEDVRLFFQNNSHH
jgi:hypothetical protein